MFIEKNHIKNVKFKLGTKDYSYITEKGEHKVSPEEIQISLGGSHPNIVRDTGGFLTSIIIK
ncbi:MAG: hypothetical protein P8Y70_15720 [Candidatus Lokiarchaeota archaeon]